MWNDRSKRQWVVASARGVLVACATALLAGCATPARMENMVARNVRSMRVHPKTLRVKSAGGRDTEWWGSSQVSDKAFLEALFRSLTTSHTFRAVVKTGKSDLVLDVFIQDVKQPILGFDMTVTVKSKWTIYDAATDEVIRRELITASHTATVGDAFVGITRLRLANEGAVRKNIEAGIKWLSSLEF